MLVHPGALASAAATALAAGFYATAAVAAARGGQHTSKRRAIILLFVCIAVYLLLAAARQVAAAVSHESPDLVDVDRSIFLVLLAPAAAGVLPLVYLVTTIASGRVWIVRAWTAAVAIPVIVGLTLAYRDGVTGPITSDYGTDWKINNEVTGYVLVGAILVPAMACSAWLVSLARRLEPGPAHRVHWVGLSSLVYFAVFTADAFGLSGLPLLVARIVTAAAGAGAWWAYRGSAAAPPVAAPR